MTVWVLNAQFYLMSFVIRQMIFSLRHDRGRARLSLHRFANLTRCFWAVMAFGETRASWGPRLAVMVLPAGHTPTVPASGDGVDKINAGEGERGCWGDLVPVRVAGRWLSLLRSILSLCWPVALKFGTQRERTVLQQSCNCSVSEMTCPVVNNVHTFHRTAQKVVGIFGDQDGYISNASNKIAVYIKSPRVLKI